MRSRYSAFALGLPEYLLESWDAATRPVELELDPELSWRRLLVESAEAGGPLDREGWVTFTADRAHRAARAQPFHEIRRRCPLALRRRGAPRPRDLSEAGPTQRPGELVE